MNSIWLVFLAAFGACIGSFLNVVIYRLPRGESIVFPGSHCPGCGRAIRWYDNIPLLSWFALGGRCRRCKCLISPRYVIIEAATAIRVAGLFACYYIFRLRSGAGEFLDTWPMFAAHASLLCGLLACAVVDAEHFQIPLEVMWVCSLAGLLAAAASPGPYFSPAPEGAAYISAAVSPPTIAVSLAAAVGLVVSLVLLRRGYIQPSFIDAEDVPEPSEKNVKGKDEKKKKASVPAGKDAPTTRNGAAPAKTVVAAQDAANHGTRAHDAPPARAPQPPPRSPLGLRTLVHIVVGTVTAAVLAYVPGVGTSDEDARNVAMSTEHGVHPRKEVLWEVLFLAPPLLLACVTGLLMRHLPELRDAWGRLLDPAVHPDAAPHLIGLGSAIFGYLIGGLWVWATRILGTLALNKEAMGMGDVHILAAVGAVTGWIVPSVTFFVSPFIGLGWVLYTWIWRRQGVLAYGPLLATGCLAVMVFHDPILERIQVLLTGGR
jgi:leader peptidase (prepilin peptidase) / N-methyltransferase